MLSGKKWVDPVNILKVESRRFAVGFNVEN